MTKIQIDHEAAKNVCHARLAQGMHPSSSDRNIARALIDLHAQLAVERARVEAMHEAWDKWMATPSSDNDTWQWETDEWQHLTGIMETRDDAHAQGDEQ